MPLAESLGFVAGVLTTFSVVPQIVRVFKLKSAREISMLFTLLLLLGMLTWLAYGLLSQPRLLPVVVWNGIGSALAAVLLYGKVRYGRGPGTR